MKFNKQKLYIYITIIGFPILLGLLSYSFHKTEKFRLFKSLPGKEENRIVINDESNMELSEKVLKSRIDYLSKIEVKTRVSYDELKFLLKGNYVIPIDARSGIEIDDEKVDELNKTIPGAINIPVEDIQKLEDEGFFEYLDYPEDLEDIQVLFPNEMKTAKLIESLNKNLPYVIYCGEEECKKSEILADYLNIEFNFETIGVYKGGWKEWKEKSHD